MAELPRFDPQRAQKAHFSQEDYALAHRFTKDLKKELKSLLHEVIFFGSAARGPATALYERDIDVLVIVNDARNVLSNEYVMAYRIITEKVAANVSGRLHINTLRVSAFWEYTMHGDPIALNIIRDGMSLLDAGFFTPFKSLLANGLISPSKENIMAYVMRAPQTIQGAQWNVMQAAIDLYWASIDMSHALLIRHGIAPISPADAIRLIDCYYIKKGRLAKHHLKTLHSLHGLIEGITARKIEKLSGSEYDMYLKSSIDLFKDMQAQLYS